MHAILFDVDGTLVDSVDAHARAWHEAMLEFGFSVPVADLRTQIGKGGDQLMPAFLSPAELARAGKDLETYRTSLWQEKYLPRVKPFARVEELFAELKHWGFLMGVVSSSKAEELQQYV